MLQSRTLEQFMLNQATLSSLPETSATAATSLHPRERSRWVVQTRSSINLRSMKNFSSSRQEQSAEPFTQAA